VSQVYSSLVTNKVFKTTRDSSFAQNWRKLHCQDFCHWYPSNIPSSRTKVVEAKEEEKTTQFLCGKVTSHCQNHVILYESSGNRLQQ